MLQLAPELPLLGGKLDPRSVWSGAGRPLYPQTEGTRCGCAGPLFVTGPGPLEVRSLVALGELFPHKLGCDRKGFCGGIAGETRRRSQPYVRLSSEDAVVGIIEVRGGRERKVVVVG